MCSLLGNSGTSGFRGGCVSISPVEARQGRERSPSTFWGEEASQGRSGAKAVVSGSVASGSLTGLDNP